MQKVKAWQLEQKQSLPLELKERYTAALIKDWYKYWDGMVYVSFSGGKDSTVLLHQVRRIYPDIPAVFVDTGLQYPEVKDFVKKTDNVIKIRPKMPYAKVIEKYGYPVISKRVARFVRDLRNPTENNEATRNLRMTGYTKDGRYCPSMKLPDKWTELVTAPFDVSEQCCDVIKKEPFRRYAKKSGRVPMNAVMAADSESRRGNYLQTGCNLYESDKPISKPMSFWFTKDVWKYIEKYDVPYSKIYDMGEENTGCVFCMFGIHHDGVPNRFQRLKRTHPKLHKYCMEKLGIKEVLEYLGIPHSGWAEQLEFESVGDIIWGEDGRHRD